MSMLPPSRDEENMQKRIENLFSGDAPPAYMSISEIESLKKRLVELETQLTVQETLAAQKPSQEQDTDSTSEMDARKKPVISDAPTNPYHRISSLSTKILLPALTVFSLALAAFFIYSFYTAQTDNANRQAEESRTAEEFFNSKIEDLKNFSLGLAIQSANNPEIQAAFARRDRNALLKLTQDSYLALDKQFDIPQYQFHLAPAVSFLRLHNVESFGDDLSTFRNTVLQVNDSLEPVAGLEVGRGGMGMRGIVPMFYKGRHTGSVEFGLNIDDTFVSQLKEVYGGDWRILLTKESLSLATLEDISTLDTGPASNLLVLASTIDGVYAPTDVYTNALNNERGGSQVNEGGRSYSITTLPLRDYKGEIIGVVDIVTDRTAIATAQTRRLFFMLATILVSLALGSYSLTRTINQALTPLRDLTHASEAIERGDLSQQVNITSQDEIGQLGHTFNRMSSQLQTLIASLEKRVQDRTHDLELAAEVGRTISEKVNNPDEMLSNATELIRSRFHLYYTQVYLVNPFEHTLTLRAGTGEVGEQLLQRGHRLEINMNSINGRAVSEKRAVIVADTAQSPAFLRNDLLPDTRSEMAIPLIVGERVVGVLDMQSEVPDALNETNLPAFEALAGQMAVAIQNAQLFEEASRARTDLEERASRQAFEDWQHFLNAVDRGEKIGFAFQENQIQPISQHVGGEHTLQAPLEVSGATIGKIQLADTPDRTWTDSDIQIIQATANQLSRHIDNLRLLAQADQYRNEAEKAVQRLTREGWEQYLQIRESLQAGFIYNQNDVQQIAKAGLDDSSADLKQPLKIRDELVGELAAAKPGSMDKDEAEKLIQQVAESLSAHIENLRLTEQTQAALLSTEKLYDASRTITATHTEQETLNELVHRLDRTGLDRIVAALKISNHPMTAEVVAAWDRDGMEARSVGNRFTEHQLPLVSEIRPGEPVVFEDFDAPHVNPLTQKVFKMQGVRSAAIVPISAGNEILGWLLLETIHATRRFNPAAIQQYLAFTEQVATIMQRQRLLARTEAQRLEIQTNEARLSEALTIARLGNWEYDVEKDLFTFNDNFYAVLHTDVETVGGYQMSSAEYAERFVHPEDAPMVGAEIAKALETTERHFEAQVEHRIFFPDGSLGYIFVSINVERDENGRIVRWYGANQDVTERKLAQNTIAERANQLETVATVSTTASNVLNPDKLLQTVVDLTKERFNLYHAHIYLSDESWNTLLLSAGAGEVGRQMSTAGHSIQMDAQRSLVARAYRERKAVIVNDIHVDVGFLPNPLLPETHAEMAVPMIVGDNVLGVFDVQSQKAGYFTEEDTLIYNTLAAQVAVALQNARLYQEQSATLTQLRELDRLKSSFLANMSHELRTPLNSILGFTDVMLEGLDGPLTPYMQNDLGLIQKNGQHLLHLINDVLDMAKIESGKLNLIIEKFSLQEIFEEVVSITAPLASEKSVSLFIAADSDHEVEINADRTRLRQVLLNLVNNAVKFTEEGRISIRAIRESNNVLISVKDTGVGIPTAHLESIFQEFTQVDSSTTRKAGGTGLGLPISRRLIQMHGGRLWAESTGISGEGSTFYVFLPIEAKVAEPEITSKS